MALVAGLAVSMLLMIIGTVLQIMHSPAAGKLMVAGMITLMVTPAVRVMVAAVGYALDGDWTFALVSLGVVAVLSVSLLIGQA
jgi:uncharacterized membrane protein